jgi:hypothetical protein
MTRMWLEQAARNPGWSTRQLWPALDGQNLATGQQVVPLLGVSVSPVAAGRWQRGRLCGGLCLAKPVQSELIEREEDGDDEQGDPVDAEYQQGERGDHRAADAQ